MSRIPYGYQIIGGEAHPHPEEAKRVQTFFAEYIHSGSIPQALAVSGVPRSVPAGRAMIDNDAYLGTEYYPRLIEQDVAEEARRLAEEKGAPCKGKRGKPKKEPVPIQSVFVMRRGAQYRGEHQGPATDPITYASQVYEKILGRPKNTVVVETGEAVEALGDVSRAS